MGYVALETVANCMGLSNFQHLKQDPFFDGCPSEIEKHFLGQEFLFKVENIAGMLLNGVKCYAVTRTCENPQVIEAFHSVDSVVIQPQVCLFKFSV